MPLICKYCLCEKQWSGGIIETKGNMVTTEPPPSWMIKGKLPPLPLTISVCSCPCHWKENKFYLKIHLDAVKEIYGGE